MPDHNTDLTPQVDSHEDRLQRVEGSLQNVSVDVGKIGVQTEHIAKSISEGFSQLKQNDAEVLSKLQEHSEVLKDHASRLKPVESHVHGLQASAKKRKDKIKAAVIGLLLAGAGAFITKAAETLWGKL